MNDLAETVNNADSLYSKAVLNMTMPLSALWEATILSQIAWFSAWSAIGSRQANALRFSPRLNVIGGRQEASSAPRGFQARVIHGGKRS